MRYSEWIIFFGTLCIAFTHKTSRAQDINIEAATFRGTGCPTGSARAVMSPDGKAISILFDRLQAAVPQLSGQNDNDEVSDENPASASKSNPNIDHKVCNIVMDVLVPQGKLAESLEFSFDFRGNSWAEGTAATIFKSALLSRSGMGQNHGVPQVLERRAWRARPSGGALSEDWTLQSSSSVRLQSRCANREDRRLRLVLKNIVVARLNNPNSRGAQITIDSTDVTGQMKLRINTRTCENAPMIPRMPSTVNPGIIRTSTSVGT